MSLIRIHDDFSVDKYLYKCLTRICLYCFHWYLFDWTAKSGQSYIGISLNSSTASTVNIV